MDEKKVQDQELALEAVNDLWPRHLKVFLYTTLFCAAIGLMNWFFSTGTPLWASFAVSFSIGWSVNGAFILLAERFNNFMHPYLAPVPISALGLAVGLLVGGSLVTGDPLFFFTDNYATLAMGVFFSIVAFIIFATRHRLLMTEAQLAIANAERERQEKLITQTELKLLQAQIEPHFLFNTLSNIAGLIHKDPDAAEKTLLNLTTLLRSSLNRTREQTVTLGEELNIAAAYLAIHKTRMSDRLNFEIERDSELDSLPLPPLIVQPLVENAIKHGIDPKEEGGHINIRAARDGTQLTITVTDNGLGIAGTQPGGTGTGLRNVRERLNVLYEGASLSLEENPLGGVVARIHIPISAEPQT